MAARKTAAATADLDPEARYKVEMLAVVPTTAFVYRPGEDHVMSGAQLAALAKAAGATVAKIARFKLIDG